MADKSKKSSKDSTSRLFNRYVWLLDVIYRSKGITFERINELWSRSGLNDSGEDLPLKTFQNHKKAIETMFGISVVCDRKGGYRYYVENSGDIAQEDMQRWLLDTFAINNLINESHKLKHRILLENIPSGQHFLTAVIEAMKNEHTIEVTYQSFYREHPHIFEVEPYCVKVFNRRWYMLAKSSLYDDLRIYALDRVTNITELANKFKIPDDFDAADYFYNSFGIIVDENVAVETITLKAIEYKAKYLRTLPLHHSQREKSTIDNYTVFEYRLCPTFDFRQELLSHGDEIEVISPQWLRNEMKDISRAVAGNHRPLKKPLHNTSK